IPNFPPDAEWAKNGATVAGGQEAGSVTNELNKPHGVFVDDDQTIFIADCNNHSIVQWKMGDTMGEVVASDQRKGNQSDQLN
ncbi:unnamed protein product, partial [Rotaria sp. Silwood2]